jgi:uncharacterized membrane protein YdbT with pleckstrin-like domain
MKRSNTLHLHGLDVFYDISQYAALLLIPLLRGLFRVGDGFHLWLNGIWIDLLAVGLMLLLGFWRWLNGRLYLSPDRLCYTRGLFFRKESIYRSHHLATLRIKRSFLLWLFKAAVVTPVPIGPIGRERRPMIVSVRNAMKIQSALLPVKGEALGRYKAVTGEVAFFTAFHSKAGTGLAILSVFLSGTGKLLGRNFQAELYGALAQIAKFFSDRLPPSIILAGGIFLLGYMFSFLKGILEYHNFTVTRYKELFWITGGLFPRYTYALYKRKVSSIAIRTRLITYWQGRFSLLIGVAGYGEKTFLPVLVPFARAKTVFALIRRLVPECPPLHCQVRTKKLAWWPFLRWPILLSAALMLFMGVVFWILPDFWQLTLLWGGMGLLWCVWLAINAFYALSRTGIGATEQGIVLMYGKKRALYRVYLPYDQVIRYSLLQSPAQAKRGLCSIRIWERGSGRKHTVYGLSVAEVQKLGLSARINKYYKK